HKILSIIAGRPPPCVLRGSVERMNWLGWALASALFAALTAILAKIGVAGVDATLATAVRTCVVLVFTWIMVWLNPAAGGLPPMTPRDWGFLVLSGIATGLSWLCYFRALGMGPASRVAPIDKLSVALVVVLAALVLGERLTWAKGIGGLLIVAGAVTIALERGSPPRAIRIWYTTGSNYSGDFCLMAQICAICGRGPQFGTRISHAHNVTKRRWNINLQS